jgi:hypothetical protein
MFDATSLIRANRWASRAACAWSFGAFSKASNMDAACRAKTTIRARPILVPASGDVEATTLAKSPQSAPTSLACAATYDAGARPRAAACASSSPSPAHDPNDDASRSNRYAVIAPPEQPHSTTASSATIDIANRVANFQRSIDTDSYPHSRGRMRRDISRGQGKRATDARRCSGRTGRRRCLERSTCAGGLRAADLRPRAGASSASSIATCTPNQINSPGHRPGSSGCQIRWPRPWLWWCGRGRFGRRCRGV